MTEISRISTGIGVLDKTLSGGLIKGGIYLISGDVGIGKTTAALQFLLKGIQDGEKVAMFTDTSQKNLIEDMHSLGLDIESPINNGTLLIIALSRQFEDLKNKVIERKENPNKVLTKILSEINNTVKQNSIKRLVIDPINLVIIPSSSAYTYAKTLISTLGDPSCTTIITSGILSPNDPSVYSITEHVSGVIILSYDDSLKRSRFFSIKKMRGTYCNPDLHKFTISSGKGICGPDEKPSETYIPDEKPSETYIPDEKPSDTDVTDEKPSETYIPDMRPNSHGRNPYAF